MIISRCCASGCRRGRHRGLVVYGTSAQAGWHWAHPDLNVFTVISLVASPRSSGGGLPADSSILLWAIVRRPHGLGQFLLPYPELLHLMQWFSFTAELTAVVVLWLRGRALLAAALFWMGFHVFTVAILYIHFAPTAICWLAFAPLERLGPWLRRVKARRRERAGGRSAGHPVPVLRDQAVDGGG